MRRNGQPSDYLISAFDALMRETRLLRLDIRSLLSYFKDPVPDHSEMPEAAFEKTMEVTLAMMRIATRDFTGTRADISKIRLMIENGTVHRLYGLEKK